MGPKTFSIFLRYLFLLAVPLLTAGQEALAALANLKQVKVVAGPARSVDVFLTFDKRITSDQAQIEMVKDLIQLTLKDTAVYPTKQIPIHQKSITKVFAYQFSPKIVRCRLFVRGNLNDYEGRIELSPMGSNSNVLRVRVKAPVANSKNNSSTFAQPADAQGFQEIKEVDRLPGERPSEKKELTPAVSMTELPQQSKAEQLKANQSKSEANKNEKSLDSAEEMKQEQEEKLLLDKVLKASAPEKNTGTDKGTTSEALTDHPGDLGEHKPLTGAKPLPSFKGVFIKLGVVCLLALMIGGVLMRLRKVKKKPGLLGMIQKMTGGSLLSKSDRLIEIVSTHHIDPKKSIVVVKIGGRMLVLGLSNDSMNLITEFGEFGELGELGVGSEKGKSSSLNSNSSLDEMAGSSLGPDLSSPSLFNDVLQSENSKPSKGGYEFVPDARSRIKSRLEGLKPL